MKLSLIITTYNWPEALSLVMKSVRNQTIKPYEIIIADDGSNSKTKDLILELKRSTEVDIVHAWQEDIGYRAARSRNNGISKAKGDYIVMIDGDMILHKNFIEDHIFHSEPGYFVQGSRVLLSKEKSQRVLSKKKMNFSFFSRGLMNRKNQIHSKLLSNNISEAYNKILNHMYYHEDNIEFEDDYIFNEGSYFSKYSAIHDSSKIGKNCVIGRGVKIGKNCFIRKYKLNL